MLSLIHIVSLTLQSVMEVAIDNQCTDIELTSSTYFIKDATCCIQFPQQVNPKSIMRTTFKTGADRDIFGGALLYHLKGKKNDEYNNQSDKDTLISTQLLVIWGYNSDRIYSHVHLIEHKSTLIWNEDKLKRLYHVYDSQYKTYSDISQEEEWLLDDNIKLKTVYVSSHGGFEIWVIISEDKYTFSPRKPLWIDPNR
jgi:hypothetical protein